MDEQRRLLEDGAVAVAGDRIAAVGPSAEILAAWSAPRTIDCQGNLLVPGLVDCLGYAGRTLVHGPSADRPVEGTRAVSRELKAKDEGFWAEEGRQNARQSLFFGITTVHRLMPSLSSPATKASAYRKALEAESIRALVSLCPDLDADDEEYARQLEECLLAAGEPGNMLCVKAFGPEDVFPARVSPELPPTRLEERARRIAWALQDLPGDRRALAQFSGGELRAFAALAPQLLRRAMVLTGMNGAGFDEISMMRDAGHSFLHSPQTYLPDAHFIHILFEGIPCGLTPASLSERYPCDLLLAARRAMLQEITTYDDYHYLPSGKALELLTIEAAQALGLQDEVGSIEAGKRADLCLFGWKTPAMAPNFMPVQTMILRGYGQDIGTVVAGGRIVKENGQLLGSGKEA